jgi:hypothetical protein
MKILFLDIDGVLNSTGSTLARVGETVRSVRAGFAVIDLMREFAIEDLLPYGPTFTLATIDPVAVGLVNRLLSKEPDLYIVLSSSHRSMFCGSNYPTATGEIQFGSLHHISSLQTYLTALGLEGDRLIDVTPRLYSRRGLEIRQWLEENEVTREIAECCAVDDDADISETEVNFVRTSASSGLDAEAYYKIAEHLRITESSIIY